jgi:hypothetical protein
MAKLFLLGKLRHKKMPQLGQEYDEFADFLNDCRVLWSIEE